MPNGNFGTDVTIAGKADIILSIDSKIDVTAEEVMVNFKDGAASSIDPSLTAESGWINIQVDGVTKYIPYDAAS